MAVIIIAMTSIISVAKRKKTCFFRSRDISYELFIFLFYQAERRDCLQGRRYENNRQAQYRLCRPSWHIRVMQPSDKCHWSWMLQIERLYPPFQRFRWWTRRGDDEKKRKKPIKGGVPCPGKQRPAWNAKKKKKERGYLSFFSCRPRHQIWDKNSHPINELFQMPPLRAHQSIGCSREPQIPFADRSYVLLCLHSHMSVASSKIYFCDSVQVRTWL